jgi:hypothetical protein
MAYKAQRRQCIATAKSTGQRCTAYACLGATVCTKHGGEAPQVRAAAAERMQEAQVDIIEQMKTRLPKALEAIDRVLNDPNARASDVLKAAEIYLDRLVAKRVHAEVDDQRESRDLDAEIEEAYRELRKETG